MKIYALKDILTQVGQVVFACLIHGTFYKINSISVHFIFHDT